MLKQITIFTFLFALVLSGSLKLTSFQTSPHNSSCYTQGLFFLNKTHVFESCGLYNKSFFHILKYEQKANQFTMKEVFKSQYPINDKVFLEGATYFPKTDKIYILTWRQGKVYKLNSKTFQIQDVLKWQKDGWGLTNNQTHMFITDGSPKIYLVDQNMNILAQKIIYNEQGNNKIYSINQLEMVKENGKQYIYANIYMQRRIVKIDFQAGRVIQQFDGIKMIQNEKSIKYDQVINGIAYIPFSKEFLVTGKHWTNFYKVNFN